MSKSLYNKILDGYMVWLLVVLGLGTYAVGFVYFIIMILPVGYVFWLVYLFRFKGATFV